MSVFLEQQVLVQVDPHSLSLSITQCYPLPTNLCLKGTHFPWVCRMQYTHISGSSSSSCVTCCKVFKILPFYPPPFPSPHLLKAGAWRWRQVYCRNFWRTFYCRTVNIFQLLKYSYLGVCDVLCRKGIVTKTQSGKFSVRINPLTPKQVGRYLGHHTLNVYSITSTTILSLVWRYDNLMLLLNLGTHVLEWTSIKRRLFACKSRQI